jgi:hypothetical protein
MKKTTKKSTEKTTVKNVPSTKRVTKTKLVLEHLIKHKSITSLEAIDKYSATRLSAIIFTLRKLKYGIITKDVTIKDKYGNTCVYGKYVLINMPPNKK